MKGFVLDSVGGDPRLSDLPQPVAPAAAHAVVRVRAAGVNPVDQKMAADPALPVPRVVGNEAVVEFNGSRAYAERTIAPHGAFAELAVVDPGILEPLPDDVADADALAIGIPGIASWMSLTRVARLQPGETVIVLGATGAVGRIAVQVARLLGAGRVVALGRDPEQLRALRDLGADAVVSLGENDVSEELRQATGDGADVVLDLVYGPPLLAALKVTRPGARVVSAGASGHSELELPFSALRGRTLYSHSNQLTPSPPKREAYRQLLGHLRRGDIRVDSQVVPLDRAAEAWRLQSGSTGSKFVLSM